MSLTHGKRLQTMPILKPADVRLAAQLALYRSSFERYAVEQLKLQTKRPGSPVVPFVFNRSQQAMNALAEEQRGKLGYIRMLIHKHRQNGGSAWSHGRCFHGVSLQPNTKGLAIAHDDPTTLRIFGYSKLFYDCLDPAFRPMSRYSNATELIMENPDPRTRGQSPGLRSGITTMPAKNALSGTGHTLHFVQLSECAKYGPKAKELWASLKPAIPDLPGTAIIMESTAWFSGDWFREWCERAQSGLTEWKYLFCPWHWTEEYTTDIGGVGDMDGGLTPEEKDLQRQHGLTVGQLQWRRERIAEQGGGIVGTKLFQQEYPLVPDESWVDLNMSAFDPSALVQLESSVGPPRIRAEIDATGRMREHPTGRLAIWEMPQPGEVYDIGADVASGKLDGDFSCAEVIKRRTREQVAEWRGHIGTLDFAEPLYGLGKLYHWAQLCPEVTQIGMGTMERLKEMQYPSLYRWRRYGKMVPKITDDVGWHMSHVSKQHLVTRARHHISHQSVIIRSENLIRELREYVVYQTDAREYYEGGGANDDTVTAWMLALSIGLDEQLLDSPPLPASLPSPRRHRESSLHDDWTPSDMDDPMVTLAAQLRGERG